MDLPVVRPADELQHNPLTRRVPWLDPDIRLLDVFEYLPDIVERSLVPRVRWEPHEGTVYFDPALASGLR
jgi:hypothetical protein